MWPFKRKPEVRLIRVAEMEIDRSNERARIHQLLDGYAKVMNKSLMCEGSEKMPPVDPMGNLIGHCWKECWVASDPLFWLIGFPPSRLMSENVNVVWQRRGDKCTRCGARRFE